MPITDTSWVVFRHPHAFLPPPWTVVLCARDMHTEVKPGVKERRSRYTLDTHTGAEWHREGAGQYEYWSNIPPITKWSSRQMPPPVGHLCLFWLHTTPYIGVNIGRVVPQSSDTFLWQIRDPGSQAWISVLSKAVNGWLSLPPEDL